MGTFSPHHNHLVCGTIDNPIDAGETTFHGNAVYHMNTIVENVPSYWELCRLLHMSRMLRDILFAEIDKWHNTQQKTSYGASEQQQQVDG
jgi:hypothetical protein